MTTKISKLISTCILVNNNINFSRIFFKGISSAISFYTSISVPYWELITLARKPVLLTYFSVLSRWSGTYNFTQILVLESIYLTIKQVFADPSRAYSGPVQYQKQKWDLQVFWYTILNRISSFSILIDETNYKCISPIIFKTCMRNICIPDIIFVCS